MRTRILGTAVGTFLALLATLGPAAWGQEGELRCAAHHADVLTVEARGALREGQALARTPRQDFQIDPGKEGHVSSNPEFEGSLSPGSFLAVLQDRSKGLRAAFSSGPVAVAGDGLALRLESSRLDCALRLEGGGPPLSAPTDGAEIPPRMLCFVDEARFENGAVVSNRRLLPAVARSNDPLHSARIDQEDASASYSAEFKFSDAARGLRLVLRDRIGGTEASVEGPANAFVSTVLFALTIGDRDKDARMLRLGCQLL